MSDVLRHDFSKWRRWCPRGARTSIWPAWPPGWMTRRSTQTGESVTGGEEGVLTMAQADDPFHGSVRADDSTSGIMNRCRWCC